MAKKTYNPHTIESKWLAKWEDDQLFQQTERTSGASDHTEKLYLLYAFAYPSGSGLHVGHVEPKTALDIQARFHRMQGKQVFFPVGWDAFGLPAENFAIKSGIHPAETTRTAIDTFRAQVKRIGISYDWANEIATSHPEYYKWTQWIFIQLYKKGLAYQDTGMVNWCPSCQTVLANEQVVNGECERCGTEVIQKELEQWFFKITKYQDELISGLETVDWPEPTKQQQVNWIGKSEGARVAFNILVNGSEIGTSLEVFTTAHDTIYGCTFMVVAPEHDILKKYKKNIPNWPEIEHYQAEAQKKSELDRQVQKEKTGVRVEGIELVNPVTGEKLPLFVADYVLAGYGTGAIMAVPGHDERDFEFAKKYDLPVIFVTGKDEFTSYSEIKQNRQSFTLKNSAEFDGKDFVEGRQAILEKLAAGGAGRAHNHYKLRDWLISRQRYWGAPIPIVYDPEGNPHPVKEEHLPWKLPTDVDFKPTGESPLRSSKEFVERTERLYGPGWRPEFDTMDTFVDSSWYYLRYTDARNSDEFASPEQLEWWLPVDFYMIGPEHIVLHLLYSRFFTKFLRDEGYLKFDEPFTKMRHQGMILGPDGKKMSKSKGNVINPDDVIEKFGADTLRVYEMFMGPIEADKPWSTTSVVGVHRFLSRIFNLVQASVDTQPAQAAQPSQAELAESVRRKLHQTIKKVTQDLPQLKYNTAIAALMEFVNTWEDAQKTHGNVAYLSPDELQAFVKLLAPLAPFVAEEMWVMVGGTTSIHTHSWPAWDEQLARAEAVTIVIQINGKVRSQLVIAADQAEDAELVIAQARQAPGVEKWLAGKAITREHYVPGRLVSLVAQ